MTENANIPQVEPVVKLSLDEKVRQLVKDRPRTLTIEDLAHQADVSESWLTTFIAGKIKNPGVRQIVAIYDLLNPTPLSF